MPICFPPETGITAFLSLPRDKPLAGADWYSYCNDKKPEGQHQRNRWTNRSWTTAVCLLVCDLTDRNWHSLCVLTCFANKADSDRTQSCSRESRQCVNYGCLLIKKLQIVDVCTKWTFHAHVEPGSAEDLHSQHSYKISITDSVPDQMWNTATISPSVPELWCWMMARKVFCWTSWSCSEADLWPVECKMSQVHHLILQDICANFSHN